MPAPPIDQLIEEERLGGAGVAPTATAPPIDQLIMEERPVRSTSAPPIDTLIEEEAGGRGEATVSAEEFAIRAGMQDVLGSTKYTPEQKSVVMERYLEKYPGPGDASLQDLERIKRHRPKTELEGDPGPIDTLVDVIDFAMMVTGKTVLRPSFSQASANADWNELTRMDRAKRNRFVSSLSPDDNAYDSYADLVDGLNEAENSVDKLKSFATKRGLNYAIEDRDVWVGDTAVSFPVVDVWAKGSDRGQGSMLDGGGAAGLSPEHEKEVRSLQRQLVDSYSDAYSARHGLFRDYFKPHLPWLGVESNRSPYGGQAPRPWSGPTDVTETLLRGALGMHDEDEVRDTRSSIQMAGGALGDMLMPDWALYNAEEGEWFTHSRVGAMKQKILQEFEDKGEPVPTMPIISLYAQERLKEERAERIEQGDMRSGLFLFEFAAMLGPDLAMVKAAPRVLVTPAGRLTREGDEVVRSVKSSYESRLREHVNGINTKRIANDLDPLNEREVAQMFRELDGGINTEVGRIGNDAFAEGKHVEAFLLDDAIEFTDDGIHVIGGGGKPVYAVPAGAAGTSGATQPATLEQLLSNVPAGKQGVFAGPKKGITSVVDSAGERWARVKLKLSGEGDELVKLTPDLRKKLRGDPKSPLELYGDYVVRQADGAYRPLRPSDTIGPHAMAQVRKLAERMRTDESILMKQFDTVAFKVYQGTESRADREFLATSLEYMSQPVKEGAEALDLTDALGQQIKSSMDVLPEMADDAERDALAHIQAANKAAAKARELTEIAAKTQTDEAFGAAREATGVAEKLAAEAHIRGLIAGSDPSLVAEARGARGGLAKANKELLRAETSLSTARERTKALIVKHDDAAKAKDAGLEEQAYLALRENAAEVGSLEAKMTIAKANASAADELYRDAEEAVKVFAQLKGDAKRPNLNELRHRAKTQKTLMNKANHEVERLSKHLESARARMAKAGDKVPPDSVFHRPLIDEVITGRAAQAAGTPHQVLKAEERLAAEMGQTVAADLREWSSLKAEANRIGKRILQEVKAGRRAESSKLSILQDEALIAAERKEAAIVKKMAREAAKSAKEAKRVAKKAIDADVALKKAKLGLAAARRTEGRRMTRAVKARQAARGAQEVVEQVQFKEDAPLKSLLVDTMMNNMIAAQEARQVLRSALGFATKEEAAGLKANALELEHLEHGLRNFMGNEELVKAIDGLTVSEAKQAQRALEQTLLGKRDPLLWEKMSDGAKEAHELVKELFDDMYNLLKANGQMKEGHSKEKFFEDLLVEGYLPHILSSKGASNIGGFFKKYNITDSSGRLNTFLPHALKRKWAGGIPEINQAYSRRIAEIGYDEVMETVTRTMDEHGPTLGLAKLTKEQQRFWRMGKEAAIDAMVVENGLDKVQLFHTDAVRIIKEYGTAQSKSVARTRLAKELRSRYPLGDRFAAMAAEDGLDVAGAQAKAAGYRRIDQASHLDMFLEAPTWHGWKKYSKEIRNLFKARAKEGATVLQRTGLKERQPSFVSKGDVISLFKRLGVDVNEIPENELQLVVSNHLYAPIPIADFVDDMVRPDWLQTMKNSDVFFGVPSEAAMTFDEMLKTFKIMVTVFAPAFHGRNYISNVIQNTMTHGLDALNPSTWMEATYLQHTPDYVKDKKTGEMVKNMFTVRWTSEAGVEHESTRWTKEWQDLALGHNVDTQNVTVTDVGREFADRKVEILGEKFGAWFNDPSPKTTAALAKHAGVPIAATTGGAAYGFASADEKATFQDRVTRAVAFGAGGMFAGMALKTGYDVFLSDAHNAYQVELAAGSTVREALHAGLKEAVDETGRSIANIGRTGVGYGILGAAAAVAMPGAATIPLVLKTGAITGTAVAGTRLGLEGLSFFASGIGRGIEQQARWVNWLTGMKKGLSPEAAAELVNQTLFDYNSLSYLERHTLRRIFPFWTWNFKNLKLQGWLMENRPKHYLAMNRILDLGAQRSVGDQDIASFPEHHRYRILVGWGNGKYMGGLGTPIENILEMTKPNGYGVLSAMNPMVPFFMKFAFGVDPYRQTEISELRSAKDVRYLPEILKDWVGYAEKIRPDGSIQYLTGEYPSSVGGKGKDTGAYRMALLKSQPYWRLVGEWNKIVTDTFLTGTVGQAAGAAAHPAERVLATMTGIKPYARDPGKLEEIMWARYQARLEELMGGRGLMYERSYMSNIPTVTTRPRPR